MVTHGERLDVLETRRRFVRVRTVGRPEGQGIEGWADSNLLLSPQQMEDLNRLAESAAKLPSQGAATVFEVVNMHAEASRQSPSFFQIAEGGSVEVIGHRATPRTSQIAPAPPPVRRTPPKKAKTKESKRAFLVPPPPVPPAPPPYWLDLSRPRIAELPGYVAPPPPPPVALEDWNLVRTRDGKTGWVLARMLSMTIPDDVAQYAEGHRITSYLALGEVKDKDKNETKNNWLWTTVSTGPHNYEFDSFRVFVWSTRRHRYETAYIERNVRGYYPIEAQTLPGQEAIAFSLVLEDKDGKLYKRAYAFSGYHVRMVSKTPYQPPPTLPAIHESHDFNPIPVPVPPETGFRKKLSDWRRRWIGR